MKHIIALLSLAVLLSACGLQNTPAQPTLSSPHTSQTMQPNNFVFADLSTYDIEKAKQFYGNVFGWEYYSQDGAYFVAYDGDKEVSGLYETPKKFQKMKMPSFWMTYIQVENVDDTVEKAKKLGAIIEATENMEGFGKVALIRDPGGAGFTIYEGDGLNSRNFGTPNTLVWNELFTTDIDNVQDFYTGIFDWNIQKNDRGNYSILNGEKEEIGAITELKTLGTLSASDKSESGRTYEYWGSVFLVDDMQQTKQKILDNGGTLLGEQADIMSFADFSGEAFFYIIEQ